MESHCIVYIRESNCSTGSPISRQKRLQEPIAKSQVLLIKVIKPIKTSGYIEVDGKLNPWKKEVRHLEVTIAKMLTLQSGLSSGPLLGTHSMDLKNKMMLFKAFTDSPGLVYNPFRDRKDVCC